MLPPIPRQLGSQETQAEKMEQRHRDSELQVTLCLMFYVHIFIPILTEHLLCAGRLLGTGDIAVNKVPRLQDLTFSEST